MPDDTWQEWFDKEFGLMFSRNSTFESIKRFISSELDAKNTEIAALKAKLAEVAPDEDKCRRCGEVMDFERGDYHLDEDLDEAYQYGHCHKCGWNEGEPVNVNQ